MRQRIVLSKVIREHEIRKPEGEYKVINQITEEILKQKPHKMTKAFINFHWIESDDTRKLYDITTISRNIIIKALIKSDILKSDERRVIIGFRDIHLVGSLYSGIHLYLDDFVTVTEAKTREAFSYGL